MRPRPEAWRPTRLTTNERHDQGGAYMTPATKTRTRVTVIYNGDAREIDYQPKQALTALLQHALNEFGITANREGLGLFTSADQELEPNQSVEDAGVKPGDQLVLRERRVAGG